MLTNRSVHPSRIYSGLNKHPASAICARPPLARERLEIVDPVWEGKAEPSEPRKSASTSGDAMDSFGS
jgi:hypothetical protein